MRYGAKNALWAPYATEDSDTEKPTYGETYGLTGLNETTDTINTASASAYGDNLEMIYIGEFSNGEISVKAVEIKADARAAALGTAADDANGLSYASEDEPPYGGYGFYRNMMGADKKKYYEVVFYPKVTGIPEAETSKTKEGSISLEYDSIKFRMLACIYKNVYKITKCFDTEAEALAYLKGLYAGTSDWPGIDTASEDDTTEDSTTENDSDVTA